MELTISYFFTTYLICSKGVKMEIRIVNGYEPLGVTKTGEVYNTKTGSKINSSLDIHGYKKISFRFSTYT